MPEQPLAPPTTPGPLQIQQRVRWPTILGSLCIAQGSINFAFAIAVATVMLRNTPDTSDFVFSAVSLVMFAGSIITGTALLMRRRWAITLAWFWSSAMLSLLILLIAGLIIDAAQYGVGISGVFFYAAVAIWIGALPAALLITMLYRRNRANFSR